ncbi:hypothetical protein ACFQZK_33060 [Rhodococcus aetherivorans]
MQLQPVDDGDLAPLRDLIARHHARTGSAVAGEILAEWPGSAVRFTAVVPEDLIRVRAAACERPTPVGADGA